MFAIAKLPTQSIRVPFHTAHSFALAIDSRPVKKKQPSTPDKRRQRFLPLAIGTSGGVMLAAAAFWFFKKQAEHVVEGRADRYDEVIMETVHRIDNPAMHNVMEAITQLGSHAAISTAAGVTALAMLAINTILKNVFQRQRPVERARRIKLPNSHSFPSGHSLLCAATYPIVAHHLVQNRSVAAQAFVHTITGATILSVGFSRVYFGVHFPSDVLGGFAAGLGWLGLTSLGHTLAESSDPKGVG